MNECTNVNLVNNADVQKIIAKNLKKLNMDITKLAQIMCISPPLLLKVFHGEAMPSLEALKRLRNYLHIPINKFFEE